MLQITDTVPNNKLNISLEQGWWQLDIKSGNSFTVIYPSRVLSLNNADKLRRKIINCVKMEIKIVILDFKNVNFIDSIGLTALLIAQAKIKPLGGKLFICSLNDQVKMLFELTRMNKVFKILANQEEFLNAYYTPHKTPVSEFVEPMRHWQHRSLSHQTAA
ncbi:MAG TPA: STAS domain-containing protein [Oculatellaceae cyanobacterium]|jgi:anti-anti-sigma factor